jgi:glucose uptake protein GlcU
MKVVNCLLIVISAFCGLVFAFITGPLSNLETVFVVNSDYINSLQKQYMYSGLMTAFFACSVAYLVKENIYVVSFILSITGILWTILSQLGDFESLKYLGEAIAEFMIPYSIVCLVLILVLFGVDKKWPRLT